ncbi:MAG: pirin family protein [Myxococcota bacterium]
MSWAAVEQPKCREVQTDGIIETVISPRAKDIGAFEVRRCLPSSKRASVGPFVFFDEMGPAVLAPGVGMDVRPHPHVNLATLTYLFEGAIHHRDSLGTSRVIEPGAVNLMVAGKGITHSERSPDEARPTEAKLHGLQLWIALPESDEETDPAFHHYPASTIPAWQDGGVDVRLLVGQVGQHRSPVHTFSEILYLTAELPSSASFDVPMTPERGLYIVDGDIDIAGEKHGAGSMVVLNPVDGVCAKAITDARVALVGGASLGPRFIDWNFVSSRKERIEQAKADWQAERFPVVPGDEKERIPLPGTSK